MLQHISNVLDRDPDYLVGVDKGSPVMIPRALPTPTALSANYVFSQNDTGKIFEATAAITVTVPATLFGFCVVVIPPASGSLTVAVSGTATINGAATALVRTLPNNPAGVCILPTSVADVYRLSGI